MQKSIYNSSIVAGSNFDYVKPAEGVVLIEGDKQKKGGLNYNFGKISKYDYEQMKLKYSSDAISNNLKIGQITQKEFYKQPTQILNKNVIKIEDNITNNDIKKLKHEKIVINSNRLIKELVHNNPYESDQFVMNENIFKNRKVSQMKTNNSVKKDYNEMNNFNLGIINNNFWGSNDNIHKSNSFNKPIINTFSKISII